MKWYKYNIIISEILPKSLEVWISAGSWTSHANNTAFTTSDIVVYASIGSQ